MKPGTGHSEKGRPVLRRRGGFAVLTVIFIIVTFAFLGMAAVAILGRTSEAVMEEYRSQQAFHVAEAGVASIAKTLSTDSDWSDSASAGQNFGPGSFSVVFAVKTADTATVRSTGTVDGISRMVQQAFTRGGGSSAFKHVLYTESSVSAGGSSTGIITGDVEAGTTITTSGGVTYDGDLDANSTTVDVPTPVWTYWSAAATTTIVGNHNFGAGTYNGIYYVTGDVSINQNVTLNGTLVSRGKVTINGNPVITITATDPNPAIICEDNLIINGTQGLTVAGYIVTLGSATVTGNSDMVLAGGLVAVGAIAFSGNTDVAFTHVEPTGTVPGFTGGETEGSILYGEWREVY